MPKSPVWFDPKFPKELRPPVKALLEKWWRIFSFGNCRGISCYFEPEGKEFAIKLLPMLEYRHVKMWFTSGWAEQDDISREEDIVHEFCEILLGDFRSFCRDTLEHLLQDDAPEKDVIMEQFRKEAECAVEDLAETILRLAR